LADHEADEANFQFVEGAEIEAAVADGAEELREIEIRHAVGIRRPGREEGAGVAAEFIPLGGGAGPGDFGGGGRSVATVGEETGRLATEEKRKREAEREETHRPPIWWKIVPVPGRARDKQATKRSVGVKKSPLRRERRLGGEELD